jgi:5-(carboxyamino)imidazole ribonucleotide synthase
VNALAPGSVIGILGGGQLGRMTALAAARLGYRTHVFTPEADGPACQVTDRVTLSGFGDRAALDAFAAVVDVATYEFENVPHAAVAHLAGRMPVRPGPEALSTCQDRVAEKDFAHRRGIATAPWRAVDDRVGLDAAIAAIGLPAVLKTRRDGYDGKGQVMLRAAAEAGAAWARMAGRPAILEGFVPFRRELSVIAARGLDGAILCYPAVENRHRDHILAETVAPAPGLPEVRAVEAEAIATTLARDLAIVGLLAVELFETAEGALLVNELAPRPHNSGHWTMDACTTDQFEQFVRAVSGLPLGPVGRFADAVMTNLIGDEVASWPTLLAEPGARLHLYGKTETRPGRKMGHVNRVRPIGNAAC